MAIITNPKSAPNTVTGARGPEQVANGRLIPDVKDEFVYITNAGAPLTVLSEAKDGNSAKETSQYAFTFGEVDILPLNIQIGAAHLAGDTALTLVAGHNARVTKTMLYRNPASGEILRCTVDPDTSTAVATFSRSWGLASGGPVATGLNVGDQLFFIGYAFGDGGTKARIVSTQEVLVTGYTQIFRTSLGVTGRNANTRMYFGKDLEQQKILRKREHMRAIDLAGFYSVKHTFNDTDTGHLVTTSDSLNNRIVSKTATLAEPEINYDLMVDIAKEAMKEGNSGYYNDGSRVKYLFAGMGLKARLDKVIHPSVFYEPDVKVPGLDMRGIRTSAGSLMFVYTPVLDDQMWQANGKTWYDAFIVDMSHVVLRYHSGRNTKLLANRQDNSEDSEIYEYMSDKGWQVENEPAHMKLTVSTTA